MEARDIKQGQPEPGRCRPLQFLTTQEEAEVGHLRQPKPV